MDNHTLHVCRPEFWAVDIFKAELSKDLRSRGHGDNFQSPMGVAHVVVRHHLSQATFTLFTGSSRFPNRMVMFSVALLLFCFVISNLWTQIFVGLTSFPLFALTLWCLWMCWDSRSGSDGRTVPAQLEFLFNAFESLRIRTAFPARSEATLASGDGSSRHSPSSSRGDVSGV